MRLLKWIWSPLKVTGAPIHLALLLVLATFCFSAFNGGAIYGVGSSIFETITGRNSVASQHTLEVANLDSQLDVEKKANSELRGDLVSAKQVSQELLGELTSEKLISQELRTLLEKEKRRTVNLSLADTCFTSIKGKKLRLDYNMDEIPQDETLRDILYDGVGEINCPAYVTLRELTPDLTNTQRNIFCLNYDKGNLTYTSISEGERDAYLVCVNPKSSCDRVNATKEEALAVIGLGTATVATSAATTATLSSAEVAVVTHSSGAVILTGTGGYIADTLGAAGTALVDVLTAPLTIAAGAVTVIGVGESVYLCK
jgi:hypothetical protein